MKKSFRKAGILMSVMFTTIFLLSTTANAAYIDPAATSYVVQIVSGVVIACGVAVGVFWKKIRLSFRNLKMKNLEKKLLRDAAKKD